MKGILIILGVLLAPYVSAEEMVRYTGQLNGSPLEMTQEVIQRSGKLVRVKTTSVFQGQTQVTVEDLGEDDYSSREDGELMIAFCTQIGGVLEQRRNLVACKLPIQSQKLLALQKHLKIQFNRNGFVWAGVVPITGLIALQQPNLSLEMAELRW